MKDRTTVQQKSANGGENKHTWTRTGWAPLHQFPPPRVKGSSQSGEQMSSQLFFLLLCYQRCNGLQENICLSIDHQARGPASLLIRPLCHFNCKAILNPANGYGFLVVEDLEIKPTASVVVLETTRLTLQYTSSGQELNICHTF